jgi:hypothetical protein
VSYSDIVVVVPRIVLAIDLQVAIAHIPAFKTYFTVGDPSHMIPMTLDTFQTCYIRKKSGVVACIVLAIDLQVAAAHDPTFPTTFTVGDDSQGISMTPDALRIC